MLSIVCRWWFFFHSEFLGHSSIVDQRTTSSHGFIWCILFSSCAVESHVESTGVNIRSLGSLSSGLCIYLLPLGEHESWVSSELWVSTRGKGRAEESHIPLCQDIRDIAEAFCYLLEGKKTSSGMRQIPDGMCTGVCCIRHRAAGECVAHPGQTL
jgi:hypothetical protein